MKQATKQNADTKAGLLAFTENYEQLFVYQAPAGADIKHLSGVHSGRIMIAGNRIGVLLGGRVEAPISDDDLEKWLNRAAVWI